MNTKDEMLAAIRDSMQKMEREQESLAQQRRLQSVKHQLQDGSLWDS